MNKSIKIINSLLLLGGVLCGLLTGCKNNKPESSLVSNSEDSSFITPTFNNKIDLYTDKITYFSDDTNLSYSMFSSDEYEDHILELEFTISVKNISSFVSVIDITNPKAYGNNLELKEEILSSYDYENKNNNKVFTKDLVVLSPNETYNLGFNLVIRDGNPDCMYRLDFSFNDTTMSVYSYAEDYTLDRFTYIHNPSYYSNTLLDAEEDSNAVYGYKPNSTGSLKGYTGYDWTSKEDVEEYKEARIKYITENDSKIKALERSMKEENPNVTIEELARACSSLRNQIRLDQYKDDPEGLAILKQRNLEKYGHEEGPLPDELYVKYNNSWETVLQKCYSTNAGMDACCGVYDMYFNMYTEVAY